MSKLNKIVKLTKEQYDSIQGSVPVIVNGKTYSKDSNALYLLSDDTVQWANRALQATEATKAELDRRGVRIDPLILEIREDMYWEDRNNGEPIIHSFNDKTYDNILKAVKQGRDVCIRWYGSEGFSDAFEEYRFVYYEQETEQIYFKSGEGANFYELRYIKESNSIYYYEYKCPTRLSELVTDSTHQLVTSEQKDIWSDASYGFRLRLANSNTNVLTAKSDIPAYSLLLTALDGQGVVALTSTTGIKETSKTYTSEIIDPWGGIFYSSISASSGTSFSGRNVCLGYNGNIGASRYVPKTQVFEPYLPLYLKCTPVGSGATVYASEPFVQELPTEDDGFIYIFLGNMVGTQIFVLFPNHPVYYYKNGAIRLWVNGEKNAQIPTISYGETDTLNILDSLGIYSVFYDQTQPSEGVGVFETVRNNYILNVASNYNGSEIYQYLYNPLTLQTQTRTWKSQTNEWTDWEDVVGKGNKIIITGEVWGDYEVSIDDRYSYSYIRNLVFNNFVDITLVLTFYGRDRLVFNSPFWDDDGNIRFVAVDGYYYFETLRGILIGVFLSSDVEDKITATLFTKEELVGYSDLEVIEEFTTTEIQNLFAEPNPDEEAPSE